MLRTPFNDGWTVAPKASLFAAALMPAAPVAVTLPRDGMRGLSRSAASPNSAHSGYYPSAHGAPEESFDASPDWAAKSVGVRFDGVYRDAVVYLAAHSTHEGRLLAMVRPTRAGRIRVTAAAGSLKASVQPTAG